MIINLDFHTESLSRCQDRLKVLNMHSKMYLSLPCSWDEQRALMVFVSMSVKLVQFKLHSILCHLIYSNQLRYYVMCINNYADMMQISALYRRMTLQVDNSTANALWCENILVGIETSFDEGLFVFTPVNEHADWIMQNVQLYL